MNLSERARRTQTVIDRFRDKPFDWAGANCIRLARWQGKALGHELPPVPMFRTAIGAKRALKKQGCESVEDLLDKYFNRLQAPSYAMVGDLVTLPSDDDLVSVMIADGHGCLIGWHDANPTGLSNVKFAEAYIGAAWRL